MPTFTGAIIEESLIDPSILDEITVLSKNADILAERLSHLLHGSPESSYWYIDYKNDESVYFIFPEKVFKVSRDDSDGSLDAKNYALSLGIPEYQAMLSCDW